MAKLFLRSEVKDVLGITHADTKIDVVLERAILQVSAEAEALTKRNFTSGTIHEYFRSFQYDSLETEMTILKPKCYPIQTVDSVRKETKFNVFETIERSSNLFTWDGDRGYIYLAPEACIRCTDNPKGLYVTYQGGYGVNSTAPVNANEPTIERNVTQTPNGLRQILIHKVANDFQKYAKVKPFTEEEKIHLLPWKRIIV
jgi:hypothetical protein